MSNALVECEGLVHIYRSRGLEATALQGLDLRVAEKEVVAIVGRSGSGKTTLMNILAGMEAPTAGRAAVAGQELAKMTERGREDYRLHVVGYLWQSAVVNLAPGLDVVENLALPMHAAGARRGDRQERTRHLLHALGLDSRAASTVEALTGAERQRLGLAVAMANRPRLLLADEPTAELDVAAAHALLSRLRALLHEERTAAIVVTHDPQVARHSDRVIQIRDGRTSTEIRQRGAAELGEELAILDRAGRLQLPQQYVERLRLGERVRLRLEQDHVRIEPE